VPPASVLLIDTDAAAAKAIDTTLSSVGHAVTITADADEALRLASDHQVIAIDIVEGEKSAAGICAEIRATPTLASIPVLCIAQTDEVEERIGFLEAGADDVIARPFDDRELEARIEALVLRFQRAKDLVPVASAIGSPFGERRRIVGVFSPKGGVGTTTIAVNLAMIAATAKPDSAVIVDLDLQFGQVATHLDLSPGQTLVDVVRDEQALAEPELLRTYTTRHDAGLHALPAPGDPGLAELITAPHVVALLQTLPGTFDTVVVDAGSQLDDRALAVFEAAEVVIVPFYAEMAALKALHILVDRLSAAGIVGAKTVFVLNSMFAKEILKPRDVEGSLGTSISANLPYDPFLYLKAVNAGQPLVRSAPRSAPAEAFAKLATAVFGSESLAAAPEAPAQEDRKATRFGGLLRRS
jgi:pilus assembly protein CpaE